MRKAIICFFALGIFSFCFAAQARADETSELKEQVKTM